MTKCLAVSPFTMPAALAAADALLINPTWRGEPGTAEQTAAWLSNPTWLGKPDNEEQAVWLSSFRRRAELAAAMPEIHRNATDSAAQHVAWLKSEGWEAQIPQGTSMDLFLASTLNIVAKWREIGRAYQEQGIDRVLLKKGARASVPGAQHPVVAVSTQQDRFNFCFQQVDTAPTTVDALTTCALDMIGTTAREEVHLDFPMVDLLVRDDAKYMLGIHAGTNVITQAAEQLRLELNEVGGRASAAAEIRVTRGIRKTPTIKLDGPFVVAIAIHRNGTPHDAAPILFAAYVDRDAWKKPAEGRI